jgi:uncharacterized membrane protein YbaN (DUF454 family)
MSTGSFDTGPDQPEAFAQQAYLPPPPQHSYPPSYHARQFGPASPQFQREYAVLPRRTNSMAIAALSCGIGQLVAGPLAGIPAIVLGSISLRQIRNSGEDGHAMAMTGLVLGIVGTALFVLVVALFIAFTVIAFHQVSNG